MFTKLSSYLGAVSFAFITIVTGHVAYERYIYVPPPTLQQQLESTVSIYTMDGSAYCSGWVKKGEHVVVTAAHCAEGDPIAKLLIDFGDGKMHPFHVQKFGDYDFRTGPDLMTLTTNDTTVPWPAGLAVCKFKPYYGERLNLLGGPLSYEKTISFGFVSNPSRNLVDHFPSLGKYASDLIQYDGQLLPGNSGGPLVDSEFGCVMGSAELIAPAVPSFPYPYGLNFMTPISDLEALK